MFFTCVFFDFFYFFHAWILFSRANFWFVTRAKIRFHRQKSEIFTGSIIFSRGGFEPSSQKKKKKKKKRKTIEKEKETEKGKKEKQTGKEKEKEK